MFPTSNNSLLSKLLIIVFLFSFSTFSQEVSNYKILGISVEGNKSADANTVIATSGLKVNDEIQIPGDKSLESIKKLNALNIFSDIQILIEKQVADGVFLVIKVVEYPRFEAYALEGDYELSESKLREKISFIRGQILKPQDISRTKQKILSFYEEEGYLTPGIEIKPYVYYSADTTEDGINVVFRSEKDLSDEYEVLYEQKDITYSNLIDKLRNRQYLRFILNANEKAVVREIEFVGNKAFDDDDLASEFSETEKAKWWKFWASAKFDKKKFEEDKKLLLRFYQRNGYRDAEITFDSLQFTDSKKEDINLIIGVNEGPQYKLRNLDWDGNTIYTDEVLAERLEFSKGDIYNYEKLQQNLRGNEKQSDVSSLYLDNGYLTFRLDLIETRLPGDSIDVVVKLEEKNQFKIGKVNIIGNDKTKDKVIRRELYSVPGDFFNKALLLRSIQQLANLQYFNVEKLYGANGIDYNLENDSTVNVAFNVEEKSSDYLNASVGYSGSYGFSGMVGVTLNNFSITEPFSLGGGQILNFNWQFGVSSLYRTFTLGFTEPWMFDTPTMFGVEVFNTRQNYVYDLSQSGGTLRTGRRLKFPDDFFYLSGFFRYQYNNILEGLDYYTEGISHQYTLGATLSRRDIDNPIFPSMGSAFSFDAELSGGPFLPGNVDYYKIGFNAEWYKRLFNTNRVALYTSANVGYIEEIVKGTPINMFELFFMGGNGLVVATTPLRGYDDRTVGPRNKSGDIIGGKFMTKFTTELRAALTMEPMPIYVLAFAEAGNTFEDFSKTDIFNLRRSVGVGARIMINPIGLIGFDLGYGFDRRAVDGNDPKWIFHFQFGKGF